MTGIYTKIFNSNMIMHISFFMLGVFATEIYNYFLLIEYTTLYLGLCIFGSIICFIIFTRQYILLNKDV